MLHEINLILWLVVGILALCGDNISKLTFGLVWFCLLLEMGTDVLKKHMTK